MSILGTLYRWFKIFAHKYDWHHAPVSGPMDDGKYLRRCHWCGFRETFYKHPKGTLWKEGIPNHIDSGIYDSGIAQGQKKC